MDKKTKKDSKKDSRLLRAEKAEEYMHRYKDLTIKSLNLNKKLLQDFKFMNICWAVLCITIILTFMFFIFII